MLKIPAVMEKARAPPPPNEMACAIFSEFFFLFFHSSKKKLIVNTQKNNITSNQDAQFFQNYRNTALCTYHLFFARMTTKISRLTAKSS
jgi:hypothetical protein